MIGLISITIEKKMKKKFRLLSYLLLTLFTTAKVIASTNNDLVEIIIYNSTDMIVTVENLSAMDSYDIKPSQFKRIKLSSNIESENSNYPIKLSYMSDGVNICLASCKDIQINKSSLIQVFTTNSGTEYMITTYDKYGDQYATVS